MHYLQQFLFFLLHIINIIVRINRSANITANTIIAGKAIKTIKARAAPTNNPTVKDNAIASIIATIPKQFLLLQHLLQQ